MTKQQSIGLRLRKNFSSEEVIEDFSALNYLTDFYFPKYKLAVEVDELGHKDRDQTKENKRQKDLKEYLDWKCIRINADEKFLIFMMGLKNINIHQWVQVQTKKLLIDYLSKK